MDCATVGSGAAGGDGGVMEGSLTTSSGGGTGGGARWNPTKEQINLLESLYSQGIRTPSAEQIQQITGRLKVYGNIEGKNVFYWFQNHKARQRQKQKQEQKVAYYSKMLHYQQQPPQHRQGFTPILPAPPPPTSTLTTNARSATHPQFPPALYNPYLPQSKLCYYPQYQPGCISIKSGPMQMPVLYPPHHHDRLPAASAPINYNCSAENGFANPAAMNHDNNVTTTGGHGKEDKTLNLFPVHPTGILQEERKLSSSSSSSSSTSGGASNSSSSGGDDRAAVGCFGSGTGRFIDFFSGHESTERG